MVLTPTSVTPGPAAGQAPAPAGSGRGGIRFRRDIEGLRAVAVVAVVLGHAGVPFVRGGYVGVDVFFVISGFLITSCLLHEMATTGRLSILSFYARRALRLLPAAILVVAVTLLAAWWWLPTPRFRSIAADAMASAVYGLNFRLAAHGTDYFAAGEAPSPLQHLWSLAMEEQFYVVWPLLLGATALWLTRRLRLWPAIVAVALLGSASFVTGLILTYQSTPWACFGTASRAWELAVGALLALCAHRLARLGAPAASALSWFGFAAVVTAAMVFTEATPFPGVAALLPVLGTAAIIAAGCARAEGGVFRVLNAGVGQVIGKLSYSWYLWHWPVLVIAPVAFDLEMRAAQGIVLVAWSFVLACLSYVVVEDPIRTGRWFRSRPRRGVTLGASLTAGLASVAVASVYLVAPASLGTREAVDTRRLLASSPAAAGRLADLIVTGARSQDLPANLTPALKAASSDRPLPYRDGCDMGIAGHAIERVCEYGDASSPTRVVLFGDSHAGHWFPALHRLALERRWRLFVLTKSACSAASTLIYLPQLGRPYTECVSWRRNALARIRELRPSLVVMSSVGGGGLPLDATGDADEVWTSAWLTTVRELRLDGIRLALISDTPWPERDVLDCLSDYPNRIGRCARPVARAVNPTRRRTMVASAVARDGVQVIDPLPWFCTAGTCPPVIGNILVYRDGSHMTTAYAEALAPVLGTHLR